jgi:hypothetical protein
MACGTIEASRSEEPAMAAKKKAKKNTKLSAKRKPVAKKKALKSAKKVARKSTKKPVKKTPVQPLQSVQPEIRQNPDELEERQEQIHDAEDAIVDEAYEEDIGEAV